MRIVMVGSGIRDLEPGRVDAALDGAYADTLAARYAGVGVCHCDCVTVVPHHHHRNIFSAECVIHAADREGGDPFHAFLLQDAGDSGCCVNSQRVTWLSCAVSIHGQGDAGKLTSAGLYCHKRLNVAAATPFLLRKDRGSGS